MTVHSHIVVTWPKARLLSSYLTELRKAEKANQVINYRVRHLPMIPYGGRCYRVHDRYVRGYTTTCGFGFRMADEVTDPITGNYWPEGNYITCNPKWYPIDPIPMVGFRGWRYFEEPPSPISEEDHQNGYSTKGGLLDRDRYADLYGVVDRSYSMPEEFVLSNLRDRET